MSNQAVVAALLPRFWGEAMSVLQRYGPQRGIDYFFWRITPPGIGAFLRQNGFGYIANMPAAASGSVDKIIRAKWVLQGAKDDWDAIFLFGPGFTPDIYDRVTNIINHMPGTRGSMIDLVNTARLAQLGPQFEFMMQVVTNPGAAGAQALGVDPNMTSYAFSNLVTRQLTGLNL